MFMLGWVVDGVNDNNNQDQMERSDAATMRVLPKPFALSEGGLADGKQRKKI